MLVFQAVGAELLSSTNVPAFVEVAVEPVVNVTSSYLSNKHLSFVVPVKIQNSMFSDPSTNSMVW